MRVLINDLNENLGHQVQRFFRFHLFIYLGHFLKKTIFVDRDADETIEWIEEKKMTLEMRDVGMDLISVQALQRKHEGLERELAALGERIYSLDEDAGNLSELHLDQNDVIQKKRTEINKSWNELVFAVRNQLSHNH